VASGACRLQARRYSPERDAHPGLAIILVHGLLSSADIYDVPGLETIGLARHLQAAGFTVVSYDQRGAGESTTDGWRFWPAANMH
jgi:pimeloyl-ACP methyl ester carboxylesterase